MLLESQYAGRKDGSIWAMRPAPGSSVLDFTAPNTPDIRKVAADALRADRRGTLPFSDDIADIPAAARSEAIRDAFAPRDIVNSAQAFDNQNWSDWLHQTRKPDFVRTPDGGVAYGPDGVEAIRLFANGGRPGAATGAALGAIPDTAALDMSHAARMQRATDMGFHPTTFYHGTVGDFPSFDLSKGGQVSSSRAGSQGVSVSPTPGVANEFAQIASDKSGGNASVMPLRARLGKVGSVTLDGSEKNLEVAATLANVFKADYDTVVLKNYTTPGGDGGNNVLVVKDPAQLRSVNAAFDPAKADSANLLYANGGLGFSALDALLQSYGLGAPQPSPASPKYRPGDA